MAASIVVFVRGKRAQSLTVALVAVVAAILRLFEVVDTLFLVGHAAVLVEIALDRREAPRRPAALDPEPEGPCLPDYAAFTQSRIRSTASSTRPQ